MADKVSNSLSRRDFLKLAAAYTGAAVTGIALGRSPIIPNVKEWLGEASLSFESRKLLDEVEGFRKSLGLEGYPVELSTSLLKKNDWTGENPAFENSLAAKNISYGEYTQEVLSKLFGPKFTRLVKGCRYEPTLPGGMAFSTVDRFCIFPDRVHDFPIDDNYINFILHEAGGHGSDPISPESRYPKEILIKVEHGKWKALTQMFNLPGEMLNNPGDQMYPMLKRQVGKIVGLDFTTLGNFDRILDDKGKGIAERALTDIAMVRQKELKDLKFNKGVCREIASSLIPALLDGKIEFKGNLKAVYSDIMEWRVGVEIYAEMLRYSIMYPEKMNGTVIEGITEVIEAINGKPVDLKEIKKNVEHPSREIIDRNMSEVQAVEMVSNIPNELTPVPGSLPEKVTAEAQEQQGPTENNSIATQPLTNQEIATIAEQQTIVENQLSDFDNFINNGILPEILPFSSNQTVQIKKYAGLFSKYNAKYPGIAYVDIANDDGFDPDMNIWDIDDLSYALDPAFVRGLIQTTESSGQMFGEVEKKLTILEKLFNVPLFP